jgi:hypothetical protein
MTTKLKTDGNSVTRRLAQIKKLALALFYAEYGLYKNSRLEVYRSPLKLQLC